MDNSRQDSILLVVADSSVVDVEMKLSKQCRISLELPNHLSIKLAY